MKTLQITDDETGKVHTLVIGQNKFDNDLLIRGSSRNDIWFHLENMSGPHFVLKMENDDTVSKRTLNYIASLFRDYKGGLGMCYYVIYTQIKNVRLTQESGTVIPKRTRRIKSN